MKNPHLNLFGELNQTKVSPMILVLVLVSLPGSYTRLIAFFCPEIMSSLDSLLTSVLSHKSKDLDTLILIYFIEDDIVTRWFANLDSIPIFSR